MTAFLTGVDNDKRGADAHALVTLITEVTGEPPVLWGLGTVGFGRSHFGYANGREGDEPQAAFSPRKPQPNRL